MLNGSNEFRNDLFTVIKAVLQILHLTINNPLQALIALFITRTGLVMCAKPLCILCYNVQFGGE